MLFLKIHQSSDSSSQQCTHIFKPCFFIPWYFSFGLKIIHQVKRKLVFFFHQYISFLCFHVTLWYSLSAIWYSQYIFVHFCHFWYAVFSSFIVLKWYPPQMPCFFLFSFSSLSFLTCLLLNWF